MSKLKTPQQKKEASYKWDWYNFASHTRARSYTKDQVIGHRIKRHKANQAVRRLVVNHEEEDWDRAKAKLRNTVRKRWDFHSGSKSWPLKEFLKMREKGQRLQAWRSFMLVTRILGIHGVRCPRW